MRWPCHDKSSKKSEIKRKITTRKRIKSTIKMKSRTSCTRQRNAGRPALPRDLAPTPALALSSLPDLTLHLFLLCANRLSARQSKVDGTLAASLFPPPVPVSVPRPGLRQRQALHRRYLQQQDQALRPQHSRSQDLRRRRQARQRGRIAPLLYQPGSLSVAGESLYVADTNNHKIRVIDIQSGAVRTLEIAGLNAPRSEKVSAIQAD